MATIISNIREQFTDANQWHHQFPWFSAGHLLEAEQQKNTEGFNEASQKAAIYFNDIQRFHWLITQQEINSDEILAAFDLDQEPGPANEGFLAMKSFDDKVVTADTTETAEEVTDDETGENAGEETFKNDMPGNSEGDLAGGEIEEAVTDDMTEPERSEEDITAREFDEDTAAETSDVATGDESDEDPGSEAGEPEPVEEIIEPEAESYELADTEISPEPAIDTEVIEESIETSDAETDAINPGDEFTKQDDATTEIVAEPVGDQTTDIESTEEATEIHEQEATPTESNEEGIESGEATQSTNATEPVKGETEISEPEIVDESAVINELEIVEASETDAAVENLDNESLEKEAIAEVIDIPVQETVAVELEEAITEPEAESYEPAELEVSEGVGTIEAETFDMEPEGQSLSVPATVSESVLEPMEEGLQMGETEAQQAEQPFVTDQLDTVVEEIFDINRTDNGSAVPELDQVAVELEEQVEMPESWQDETYDPDDTDGPEETERIEPELVGAMDIVTEKFEISTVSHSLAETAKQFKEESTEEELIIPAEAYHTVDYFASQGIRLELDPKPDDKFGLQLKSFTSWLKQMKRLPATKMAEKEYDPHIENIASNSLQEGEVVTESMAEVLMKQGKQAQAVEVWEKLSLLYPEKSHYFATLIEKTKV
ncbi:MAG: hypothetical protein V4722_07040 [Bacteroidota bacterium]